MDICFLNYISRSGSTLLSSYLDANPEVFVTIEADLPKVILEGETHSKEELLRILRRISKGRKFKNWNISVEEMYNRIDVPVANIKILEQILLLYFEKEVHEQDRKAKIIVFKSFRPSIFDFEDLVTKYPSYKMLYVYRDPRAVYNSQSKSYGSFFNLPFTASPFEFTDTWKANIKEKNRLAKIDNFKSVRYEDFVTYPQKVLEDIFDFWGVNNINSEERDVNYENKIPASQKSLHKLVGKEINENRVTAWKKELNSNAIQVIENICSREMRNCGYELYNEHNTEVNLSYKLKVKMKQNILNYSKQFKELYFAALRKAGFQ